MLSETAKQYGGSVVSGILDKVYPGSSKYINKGMETIFPESYQRMQEKAGREFMRRMPNQDYLQKELDRIYPLEE